MAYYRGYSYTVTPDMLHFGQTLVFITVGIIALICIIIVIKVIFSVDSADKDVMMSQEREHQAMMDARVKEHRLKENLVAYLKTQTSDWDMINKVLRSINSGAIQNKTDVDNAINRILLDNPGKYCVKCKTKVDKDEKFCSNCGHDLSKKVKIKIKEDRSRNLKWLYFIILIVLFVIFVKIFGII